MWELIEANKRKSLYLLGGLLVCLVVLGYFVGGSVSPQGGAVTGVWIAVCLWGLLSWTGYYWGESMILSAVGAKEISHEIHPLLFNVVEEMKIAANLSAMPKIYIAGESAPNAFATGIQKEKCAVVVTVGLLTRLNRDELQGVVAHEMSHIANRDVLFMMLAGSTLGSIELISQFFLRGAISSGGSSRRYESGAPPKASGPLLVITLVVALVAALLAKIFYFSLSRKREFLADACAARYTRYPEGLASALEKISASNFPLTVAEGVVAPMCTVSPWLKEEGGELSKASRILIPLSRRECGYYGRWLMAQAMRIMKMLFHRLKKIVPL